MRRTLLVLVLLSGAAGLAGCDDLGVLAPVTGRFDLEGRYHAEWAWRIEIPRLRYVDGGVCRDDLVIDRQWDDDFQGRFNVPLDRACIPTRSGDLEGRIDRDGDLVMELELRHGRWGVFDDTRDCRVVWADHALRGRYRHGRITAWAEARYECWFDGYWYDTYLDLELRADR